MLYEDDKGTWKIQAIPLTHPVSRTASHSRRRGVESGMQHWLSSLASRGAFVHAAGFIVGNKTFEGALAIDFKSLGMD